MSQPWVGEPDEDFFLHCNLPCVLVRNERTGTWLGYVGTPHVPAPNEPGGQYDGDEYDSLAVHGGVTWSGEFPHPTAGGHELPYPGHHWVGFDAAHAWDYMPRLARTPPRTVVLGHEEVYRTLDYMRGECRSLACQLAVFLVGDETFSSLLKAYEGDKGVLPVLLDRMRELSLWPELISHFEGGQGSKY